MIVGPRAIALIKSYEQCRRTCYLPTPDDVPTIGWGSTGADIHLGMVWSQQQCDERFTADIAEFAKGVEKALAGAPTAGREFGAMVSLAYNIGLQAFRSSTLLQKHIAGDKASAAAHFADWVKQKGKTLGGLVQRREAERKLYLGQF